ncbi:MAG: NAD(P)-dependent oxidoreductase [Candidatus Gastranaerophilales bacterium]|nr:NAD(P)-dependent oxidoreductase [Candidatus Gastranaerophilales bacterium]
MKIVFFDVRENEAEVLKKCCTVREEYRSKCGKECHCQLLPEPLDEKTVLTDDMKQADIISCFTFSRINADILKQFLNLKLIALRCVGFNHIDIDYCKEHNIAVVNSLGYGNVTVAEFAFGLMLDVMRKISRSYINLKNEYPEADSYTGFELKDKNIGIIGTGAIGAEAVRIAKGFGMNVLAYDLYPKEELVQKYDVKYLSLNELLKSADIISLHAPLTKDNFHMINKEKINLMKPTVIIINTARGELIDSKALYEALLENRIFGAGLDVLEAENILTRSDTKLDFDYLTGDYIRQTLINERLLKLHNVVITPHIAYNTYEAQERILNITLDNISSFFAGKIINSVN